jgi:DNA-binding SARP family transcriptional activator
MTDTIHDWAEADNAELSVSVLGAVRVMVAGRDIRIRHRKAQAVMAYLALSDYGRETRERLVGLLWSESDEAKARASLRQVLHGLRETLLVGGFSGLITDRLEVLLEGRLHVDCRDVLKEAQAFRVCPLLLDTFRVSEKLLEGLDDLDPSFRVWLFAKRQAYHDSLLRALETGLREGSMGELNRRRLAEAILRLDPTHEEACRALMRLLAEAGDIAGALRHYNALWTVLDEEYGMEPSFPTTQLVAEIKQGMFDVPAAAAPHHSAPAGPLEQDAVARPGAESLTKPVLLVAPFEVNGVGADTIHLVQGFQHDMIASLVRFREWYVTLGNEIPAGGGYEDRVSAVYSVEATAYQAGGTINLVLTLRERKIGVYIWSERFELALAGWFEAQQQIVRRIAMSLNVQLSTQRLVRLAHEPDVSLEIYDQWLRCQSMILSFKPGEWDRATKILTEMIDRAPRFSSAYSSLAQLNNTVHIVHPGVWRERGRELRSLEYARQAVRLDPTDSRAQLCLGWSLAMSKRYAEAETHMALACELNPNDSWTLIAAALFHAFCGNVDTATDLARQSLGLTLVPGATHWAYDVSITYLCGDWEGTLAAADMAQDVIRTLPAWRAAALWRLGRGDEATHEVSVFLSGVRAAWAGDNPPTDELCGRWLLHLYPISLPATWELLRAGIVGAGVPAAAISHHEW